MAASVHLQRTFISVLNFFKKKKSNQLPHVLKCTWLLLQPCPWHDSIVFIFSAVLTCLFPHWYAEAAKDFKKDTALEKNA